jgi:hypothetical protein
MKTEEVVIYGLAKKDNFRGITAKNAIKNEYFVVLAPTPRGDRPQFAKKSEHFDCENCHFAII